MCVIGAPVSSVSHWVTQLPAGLGDTRVVCLSPLRSENDGKLQTSRQTSPNNCASPGAYIKDALFSPGEPGVMAMRWAVIPETGEPDTSALNGRTPGVLSTGQYEQGPGCL